LTRRDILAHQNCVPWPAQRQVEQDLLLCHAMTALFNDEFLSNQIAVRGGTLLHKVYLAPPSRYSEDIDLARCSSSSGTLIVILIRPLYGGRCICHYHIRTARSCEQILGGSKTAKQAGGHRVYLHDGKAGGC
jgi:hypothetical protein